MDLASQQGSSVKGHEPRNFVKTGIRASQRSAAQLLSVSACPKRNRDTEAWN
ncbi:MAG: hypothetical protein K2K23_10445 [Muribaculaceae bacterium]|nr:hypothetical protein [Muribaculaceae bacterium]